MTPLPLALSALDVRSYPTYQPSALPSDMYFHCCLSITITRGILNARLFLMLWDDPDILTETLPAPIRPRDEWLASQLDNPISRPYTHGTPNVPPPLITGTLAGQQTSLPWKAAHLPPLEPVIYKSHSSPLKPSIPHLTSEAPWNTDTACTEGKMGRCQCKNALKNLESNLAPPECSHSTTATLKHPNAEEEEKKS